MGDGPGFFFVFFAGLLMLAVYTYSTDGEPRSLFDTRDTQPFAANTRSGESFTTSSARVTESDLASAYRDLEQVRIEFEDAQIRGERSPFEGMLTLRRGNTFTEEPEEEYLTIYAHSSNREPVNITNWSLESYVTGEGSLIQRGIPFYSNNIVNRETSIELEPGETAIVVTGESPLGVSFHENRCIGYLGEQQDFIPSLPYSCPSPRDEMERYTNVGLDDDACYDFVNRLSQCRTVDDDEIPSDVGNACRIFLQNDLTYRGCLENHQGEPFFNEGRWRIYLDRVDELWRDKREIILLIDANGRTVDVLEY